jgi:hypothetical protein
MHSGMATPIKSIVKTVAGVMGTAAGVAVGLTGRSAPRKVDAANEELYWREHFAAEPYYDGNFGFEDYLPAWRTGWEGRAKYAPRSFEAAERDLQADFHWNRGQSRLRWEEARQAVHAAWDHAAS